MTDPLRAGGLTTQAAVLIGVAGLGVVLRAGLPLGDAYPLKAAAAFAVVMVVSLPHVRRLHPFAGFGPANQITTIRAGVVALLAGLIGEAATPSVAWTVVAGAVVVASMDGLDGWAARRTRMASPFGARFDVETDAALILVLAVIAWRYGKAGPWILVAGLLRYAFVAAGWLWPWMRHPLPPSLRGRAICVLQIGALAVALLPGVRPPVSAAVAAAGLLALCYSFLVDTLWLWRRARTP